MPRATRTMTKQHLRRHRSASRRWAQGDTDLPLQSMSGDNALSAKDRSRPRLRVLQVIHGYPMRYNAGSEVYTQGLCRALAERHETHVFTRQPVERLARFRWRRGSAWLAGAGAIDHCADKRGALAYRGCVRRPEQPSRDHDGAGLRQTAIQLETRWEQCRDLAAALGESQGHAEKSTALAFERMCAAWHREGTPEQPTVRRQQP